MIRFYWKFFWIKGLSRDGFPIILTACKSGPVKQLILNGDYF
jgi:hypothetical protein